MKKVYQNPVCSFDAELEEDILTMSSQGEGDEDDGVGCSWNDLISELCIFH